MNAKEESITFSDDTATDLSIYYPSMHDHLQGLAVAATLLPRRKLKRLLILSMLMTLGMALLSVYSTHILSRLGLVALWQHYDDVTNTLLVQISTQLLAAGLIDNSTMIPFPRPPQSCKLNTPLCNISLPWLYGSVISLSCAFGVLQTLSKFELCKSCGAHHVYAFRPPDPFLHLDCAVPPGACATHLEVITLCDRLPRPHLAQAPCVVACSAPFGQPRPQFLRASIIHTSSTVHQRAFDAASLHHHRSGQTHHLPDITPSSTAPRARLPRVPLRSRSLFLSLPLSARSDAQPRIMDAR
ncbi:hypothetical protein EDB89DRAFT_2070933 [Lactarius sanguifluus]|nr:hypothetical protein EDB89DRAFT_2070933 [Lactarius sanguifluus]